MFTALKCERICFIPQRVMLHNCGILGTGNDIFFKKDSELNSSP